MAKKSPLALVKEIFGDKAKLVQEVEKLTNADLWVARVNKDKGLAHVSNSKLLRLHATFAVVKEKFGTREKLIDAILDLEKRPKDARLREKLLAWPVPRLYDTYKSSAKRHAKPASPRTPPKAEGKAGAATAAKPAASKKVPKKAAAKPTTKAPKKAAAKKSSR
jgi:hypothetical protein